MDNKLKIFIVANFFVCYELGIDFFGKICYNNYATQFNIFRPKFTFGKNVGFACHLLGRCELCRNRSGTAFFGAWFRLRTFLFTN